MTWMPTGFDAMSTQILIVCMGNICRSPIVEGLLRHKLMAAGLALRFVSAAPLNTAQLTLFFIAFNGGLYLLFAGAITIGRRR